MNKVAIGAVCLTAIAALAACAAPTAAQPTPGGPAADVAFPPLGAAWSVRVTNLDDGSSYEETRRAISVDYKGGKYPGTTIGYQVFVVDPATRNLVAILRNGNEESTWDPDTGQFSWPLFVGKTWSSEFTENEAVAQRRYIGVRPNRRVEAYEDVTVPAGTFKAFRIQTSPGVGFVNSSTDWYAPEVKLIVRTIYHGSNRNGILNTRIELLTRPK